MRTTQAIDTLCAVASFVLAGFAAERIVAAAWYVFKFGFSRLPWVVLQTDTTALFYLAATPLLILLPVLRRRVAVVSRPLGGLLSAATIALAVTVGTITLLVLAGAALLV